MQINLLLFIPILLAIGQVLSIHPDITCEDAIVNFTGYKCHDIGTSYFTSNSYSATFRIQDTDNGNISLLKIKTKTAYATNNKELKIIAEFKDTPNVARFSEPKENDDFYFFVMNYGEKGNLKDFMKNEGFKDQKEAMQMFRKIVNGLVNIHKKRYVHGNLSIKHIVVDSQNEPYIIDFSTAVKINDLQNARGDILFMSAELLRNLTGDAQEYTEYVDVYSAAVVLYYMFYKEFPYSDGEFEEIQQLQELGTIAVYPNSIEQYISVMIKRLSNHPDNRGTAELFLEDIDTALAVEGKIDLYGGYRDLSDNPRGDLPMGDYQMLLFKFFALLLVCVTSYGLYFQIYSKNSRKTSLKKNLTADQKTSN